MGTDSRISTSRLDVVDALRGFALLGIVFVHFLEHFAAGPMPPAAMEAIHPSWIDGLIDGLGGVLVRGKFFALFSFLFGFSFFLQMDNAARRGTDFRLRFAWRLLLLFAIGYAHHAFYAGDILTIYAVVGLCLLPFYYMGNRLLVVVAMLIQVGITRMLLFAWQGDALLWDISLEPGDPIAAAHFEALANGTLGEVWRSNLDYGMKSKIAYQLSIFNRGFLTLSFFLFGLWAGRQHFFSNLDEKRPSIRRWFRWSVGATVALLLVTIGIFSITQGASDTWLGMLAFTAWDLFSLSFAALYVLGFCLVYLRPSGEARLRFLAPFGRMALTNYVTQSLVGTFLFFGWGLGYIGQIRQLWVFGIVVVVVIAQVLFSRWWLQRFHYGPLEWAWRSATYLRWQPIGVPKN